MDLKRMDNLITSLKKPGSRLRSTGDGRVSKIHPANTIDARAQKTGLLSHLLGSLRNPRNAAATMDAYLHVCQRISVEDFASACEYLAIHWDSDASYGAPAPADLRRCALRIIETRKAGNQTAEWAAKARRLQEFRDAYQGDRQAKTPAEMLADWEARTVPAGETSRQFHADHLAHLRRKVAEGAQ